MVEQRNLKKLILETFSYETVDARKMEDLLTNISDVEVLEITGYQASDVLKLTNNFKYLRKLEISISPDIMKAVIQHCTVIQVIINYFLLYA